ncbi:MAG: putative enzyme related to lactoylglutathione lyase [Halieaceae bacterium]
MINIRAANTILYCKKWGEVIEFYKKNLNLDINISNEWFVEFRITDHSYLSIADESRASIKSSNGQGVTITFEVEDIEATHIYLKEKFCNPSSIKNHSWGAKVIHIYDPEGNRLEFWCNK